MGFEGQTREEGQTVRIEKSLSLIPEFLHHGGAEGRRDGETGS